MADPVTISIAGAGAGGAASSMPAWLNAGASLLGAGGAIGSAISGKNLAEDQIDYQKDLAHKAIRWRVKDARKAGIHPLYALGASPGTYSPVNTAAVPAGIEAAGQHLGNLMRNLGKIREPVVDQATGETHTEFMQRMERENAYWQNFGMQNDAMRALGGTVNNPFGGGDNWISNTNAEPMWKPMYSQWGPLLMPNAQDFGESMEALSSSKTLYFAWLDANMRKGISVPRKLIDTITSNLF